MKFTIQQKILLNNLSIIGKFFLNKSININILGNVYFKIPKHKKYLQIICITYEMEIYNKITDLQIYNYGSCIIYGNKILNICKTFNKNNDITFEVLNNKIIIISNKTKFILNSLNIEISPNLLGYFKTDNNELLKLNININKDIVYQLLQNTYFSMPNQEYTQSVLNGMLVEFHRDHLTAVTMNGHRISICSIYTTIPSICSLYITQRTVYELMRILKLKKQSNIEMNLSVIDNYLKIQIENMYLITKLLSSNLFPDYQTFIKNESNNSKTIIINNQLLKESCLRITALNNDKYNKITIIINNSNLKLFSQNNEYEEAEEVLPIKYDHSDIIKISFNVQYLIEALNVITTEEVKILIWNESSLFSVSNYGNNNCQYLIMPMNE